MRPIFHDITAYAKQVLDPEAECLRGEKLDESLNTSPQSIQFSDRSSWTCNLFRNGSKVVGNLIDS